MLVDVPTTERSKYFTGMTTEFFEQAELPPPKGLWSLNTDRLLKVACQMEQTGSYTPQDEVEFDEEDQNNFHVNQQGVILDEHGNFDLVEAMSEISLPSSDSDDELPPLEEADNEILEAQVQQAAAQQRQWGDESVTTTVRPHFSETEPSMATINPLDFRKRSHFNGRPFASWGNLCPPLYASILLPLAPMTQKFWWQVARDRLPAEKNSTGVPEPTMVKLIQDYMKPVFEQQQWDQDIMEGIAYCKMSTMDQQDTHAAMEVFLKSLNYFLNLKMSYI